MRPLPHHPDKSRDECKKLLLHRNILTRECSLRDTFKAVLLSDRSIQLFSTDLLPDTYDPMVAYISAY